MSAAGRVVEVEADRLIGWVARFGQRHPTATTTLVTTDDGRQSVEIRAADGARAEIAIPFDVLAAAPPEPDALVARVVDHLRRSRRIGVLLVRRTGWAAGVVVDGVLTSVGTGGGYVQGRTKAGGWSQQRYARRRGNQSQQVYERAADGAAAVLLPHRSTLDALVTGGDRAGVAAVLADPRLVGLAPLVEPRFLAVQDPRRSLDDVVRRLRAVAITLSELA